MNELERVPGFKPLKPEGAFYIWLDVSTYLNRPVKGRTFKSTSEISAALLEEKLVAVVPGAEFGIEGYLRLSYALQSDKIKDAVARMREFFT